MHTLPGLIRLRRPSISASTYRVLRASCRIAAVASAWRGRRIRELIVLLLPSPASGESNAACNATTLDPLTNIGFPPFFGGGSDLLAADTRDTRAAGPTWRTAAQS